MYRISLVRFIFWAKPVSVLNFIFPVGMLYFVLVKLHAPFFIRTSKQMEALGPKTTLLGVLKEAPLSRSERLGFV